MATTRTDPYFGYNFAVELDGITSMGFKTCAGLDTSTTSTKYREGTDVSLAQRELPALLHHTAITYGAVGGWYYKEAPTDGSLSSMLLVFFCTLNQAWFMVRVGVADLRPRRGAVACTRRAASGA